MRKFAITAFATFASVSSALAESGDASRGQQDFRACAPCHSLEPDRNMTGPSLAGLWGRQAGSLPSFDRYSDALKSSGIIWDNRALDGWLTDPQRMVPDNDMPFEGIKDARVRADLLAFLKDATKPGAAPEGTAQAKMKGMGGMMGGMMGGGHDPNLKSLEPSKQVKTISPRHLSRDHRRRQDARLLGTQPALHDRLQPKWAGKRCTRDHAGRHDGRSRCRDFRCAGRDQQNDRSSMLIAEPFGSGGVGHA
jgi:cytochrome c